MHRFNVEKVNDIWQIQSKNLDILKTYTVAFSDYLLKGFDIGFLSNKNKEVLSIYHPKENELSYDIRKAVVEYLKFL